MSKKEKSKQEPEAQETVVQEPETTEQVSTEQTPEVTVEEAPQINWEEKYNAEHDTYLRLAAEFDNFRKRTIKEKEASYGNGKSDAVAKLLPIYDILERAVNQPTEDAAYKKGVELTVVIDSDITLEPGDSFDPAIHNAVMHTEDENLGENTIAQVFQKGFKLGDKIVRFAMVQVAN